MLGDGEWSQGQRFGGSVEKTFRENQLVWESNSGRNFQISFLGTS